MAAASATTDDTATAFSPHVGTSSLASHARLASSSLELVARLLDADVAVLLQHLDGRGGRPTTDDIALAAWLAGASSLLSHAALGLVLLREHVTGSVCRHAVVLHLLHGRGLGRTFSMADAALPHVGASCLKPAAFAASPEPACILTRTWLPA